MSTLSFFVAGNVSAQGSKRHVGRGVLVDMNAQLKPWRTAIAAEATITITALPAIDRWPFPLVGPVSIALQADYARPKFHYGTGRNATVLKESAPQWKTSAPDSDKVARAALDALTGVVYKDDAQVAELNVVKTYTEDQPGLHVWVEEL